ncbi:MAG TPA: hypothetical protein PLC42_04225 [Parachlamydiaceae bacterium]|nr:hypothetical protein [Parachlamydiaceae bacterium]
MLANNIRSAGYNACIALIILAMTKTSVSKTLFALPIAIAIIFAPVLEPRHLLITKDRPLEDDLEPTLQEKFGIVIEPKIAV